MHFRMARKSTAAPPCYDRRMPRSFLRVVLFVSSYAPLLIILAIENRTNRVLAISILAVAAISVIALFWFLATARRLQPITEQLDDVSSRDSDVMSYIVTYFLPFLGINLVEIGKAASLLIVFLVLGVIYVHSNLIYINPVLNFAGYHVFEVVNSHETRRFLITRRDYVKRGTTVSGALLGNYILLETSHDSAGRLRGSS